MRTRTVIVFTVIILLLLFCLGIFAQQKTETHDTTTRNDDVTIYHKIDFDKGMQGFYGSKKVRQILVDDATSGKALKTVCKAKWSGPALNFNIKGSENLKMAFWAKGNNFPVASINVYDKKANDNTTPYGYRILPDKKWTPVLYYLDRFRYNSKSSGYVKKNTAYAGVRFYGPQPKGQEVSIILDNFVLYRGKDKQPPEKVAKLKAKATQNSVLLNWNVARDNVSTMVYIISRAIEGQKFVKIAETFQPRYLDKSAGREIYYYRVLACDFENNLGPWSDAVKVTSISEGTKSQLSQEEKDRLNYADHVRKIHNKRLGKVRKGHVCLYGDSLTGATIYPHKTMATLNIYTVNAHGFAGMTTGWGMRNVVKKALEPENPEFMLVLFGTNNVRGKMRKQKVFDEWVNQLEAIVKAGESQGTIVVLGTIPPRQFDDPQSRPEALFNASLIKRARKSKVPVAYIFRDIQAGGNRKKFIWSDGIHWTSKGMETAAKAWAKTIRQVEFALRDRT